MWEQPAAAMAQNKKQKQTKKQTKKKQAGKLMAGCLCSSTSLHCTEEKRDVETKCNCCSEITAEQLL